MRIARHAQRHGYPRFSDDAVVQFLVEEALDLRLALDAPAGDAVDASAAAVEDSLARAQRIFGG